VASFNDWFPVELKTIFHVRKMKEKGAGVEEWVQEVEKMQPPNPHLLKSRKNEENIA